MAHLPVEGLMDFPYAFPFLFLSESVDYQATRFSMTCIRAYLQRHVAEGTAKEDLDTYVHVLYIHS